MVAVAAALPLALLGPLLQLLLLALAAFVVCSAAALSDDANCPIGGVPPSEHDRPDISVPHLAGSALTARGFLSVVKQGRPMVIASVTQGWPASTLWQDESYLTAKAGKTVIDVEAGDAGDKYFHASWQEKHRSMTLAKYLKQRKAGGGVNLYWAQSALPQPLVADVIEPEWAKWQDPWALLVWHGPGGQVTKAHSDIYDNLICMVAGRKTLHLYSPAEHHLLQSAPTPTSYLAVDLEKPNHKALPSFRSATRHVATLETGDCLYLPALWTHQVYTGACENTAINLWYRPKLALPLLLLHQIMSTQLFHRSEIVHGLLGGSDHVDKANQMRLAVSSVPSSGDSDGPFAVYMTAVKKEKKEVVAAFDACDLNEDDAITTEELAAAIDAATARSGSMLQGVLEKVMESWSGALAAVGVEDSSKMRRNDWRALGLSGIATQDAAMFSASYLGAKGLVRESRTLWRPRGSPPVDFAGTQAVIDAVGARGVTITEAAQRVLTEPGSELQHKYHLSPEMYIENADIHVM